MAGDTYNVKTAGAVGRGAKNIISGGSGDGGGGGGRGKWLQLLIGAAAVFALVVVGTIFLPLDRIGPTQKDVATQFAALSPQDLTKGSDDQEIRLALVISQSTYTGDLGTVAAAQAESGALAAALTGAGFQVARQDDLDHAHLKQALSDFRAILSEAGPDAVGFVYYTGHGMQNPDTKDSYLLGTDAMIRNASDLEEYGLSIAEQRNAFARTGAAALILVFDACRDTPSVPGWKAGTKGLARVDAATEMLIAYSTEAGAVAAEGVYAPVLAREIAVPGRDLESMFAEVQRQVAAGTNSTQLPWFDSKIRRRKICMSGCEASAGEADPT